MASEEIKNTDTLTENEEKANAIDHLSKAGQNITDEKPQNIQIDKDRGHGM